MNAGKMTRDELTKHVATELFLKMLPKDSVNVNVMSRTSHHSAVHCLTAARSLASVLFDIDEDRKED